MKTFPIGTGALNRKYSNKLIGNNECYFFSNKSIQNFLYFVAFEYNLVSRIRGPQVPLHLSNDLSIAESLLTLIHIAHKTKFSLPRFSASTQPNTTGFT